MRKVSLLAIFLIIAQIIVGENLYSEKILSAVTGEAISQQTDTEIGSSIDYRYVSNFEALDIAKSYYGNTTEVDYYISTVGCKLTSADQEACDTSTMPDEGYEWLSSDYNWLIIVDEEPNKSWNHACGYVYVQSKVKKNSPVMWYRFSGQKFPTNTRFDRVDAINRYGERANIKPSLTASPTDYNTAVASRTYALVLDCASGQEDNKEQYWNDCSFIYKVLNKKYNVPEDNIYVLMGGYDAETHRLDVRYNKADGNGFDSCSDLDGNGTSDIHASVGRNDLYNTIRTLAQKVTNQDQLLVFVTGNGGYDNDTESNYIQLWNGEKMMSMQFDDLLDGINARAINIVLGQSMAGGFAQALSGKGKVVCAACDSTEAATSCSDIPFTEFLYRWTSAMNQADAEGCYLHSDTNDNGIVTVEEAFAFARNSVSSAHPTMISTPRSIGEDLAFNFIPDGVDLYIRDVEEDTGTVPSTLGPIWNSPDIWIRTHDDGFVNQYSEPIKVSYEKNQTYIYVRVTNRGQDDYMGSGKYLHINWAEASTVLDVNGWFGIYAGNKSETDLGGSINAVEIKGIIRAGESKIVRVRNTLDDGLFDGLDPSDEVTKHTCLLAYVNDIRRNDKDSLPKYDTGCVKVAWYKNIAQRNLSISYMGDNNSIEIPIHIRNTAATSRAYNLEVVADEKANSTEVFSNLEIAVEVSPAIYRSWKNGGGLSTNVKTFNNDPYRIKLNDSNSKIQNIMLDANQSDILNFQVSLVANEACLMPQSYLFHIIQRDVETGEILGGEAFEFITGMREAVLNPDILSEFAGGEYLLKESNVTEDVEYEWSDSNRIISTEKAVTIDAATASDKYQLKVKSKKDGAVNYSSIELEQIPIIKSLSPIPFNDRIEVALSRPATEATKIIVTSATNTLINESFSLNKGAVNVSIDTSAYPKGSYIVSVIEADKILGSKTVVK